LFDIHGLADVRQKEIHKTGALIIYPGFFDVWISISKSESYKSPGIDQIPAELIQTGGETLCS
jgi:hypothetical protein